MPKGKCNKPKQCIDRETADNVLDESQVEALRAQCRRDYVALVPLAVSIVKRMLEGGPVDQDIFSAAVQVLKGTGVHEERARSKNDVKISQDFTGLSDDELNRRIEKLRTPRRSAEA
jgi:hypothetical protein